MQSRSPCRVLHVFTNLNRGGAESRTMDIYRRINPGRVQFDFMVHSPNQGAYEDEIINSGGHVYRVPRFRILNLISYTGAWARFLRENHYDCIHIHMLSVAVPALLAAKRRGIACRVCHSRSASEEGLLRRAYSRCIRPFVRRLSTHRLAVSDEAGRFAFHHDYKVVKNAIHAGQYRYNPSTRDEIRESLGITNQFVLGHVGSFRLAKNHLFLLELFEKVLQTIPHAQLVLVGDGELRQTIAERIETLGLAGKVTILGVRNDVPDLLQAFDLFVFPSIYEGLPGAALEAQAAGLPCLLSNAITPEAKAINDLVEFLPINEGVAPWVEAVLRRYNSPCERRDTYGEMKTAGFDIDSVAAWYEGFYLKNTQKGRIDDSNT